MATRISTSVRDLISSFEEEQRNVVFTALSEYMNHSIFTDVNIVCKETPDCNGTRVKAHKVVLASSSKFFRDLFMSNSGIQDVDINRELSQNDLHLTHNDVQLIIGILYCMGTVEIPTHKVQSLLIVAQVLGIPSLIRFLKKINSSITGQHEARDFLQYCQPESSSQQYQIQPQIYMSLATPSTPFPSSRDPIMTQQTVQTSSELPMNALSEQSSQNYEAQKVVPRTEEESFGRSQSRATLASFESFSLQQLPSPLPRENGETEGQHHQSNRVVHSVLENLDPNFFNNFPANQIDDLESALLPHLHNEDSQEGNGNNVRSAASNISDAEDVSSSHEKQTSSSQRENDSQLEPDNASSPLHDDPVLDTQAEDGESEIEINPARGGPVVGLVNFSKLLPENPNNSVITTPVILRPDRSPVPADSDDPFVLERTTEHQSVENIRDEIQVSLDTEATKTGQKIKFAIPGTSSSVTLNFSPEALKEMRNSVESGIRAETDRQNMKIDSEQPKKKGTVTKRRSKRHKNAIQNPADKEPFQCYICSKTFKRRTVLDRHLSYHVDTSTNCSRCGSLFGKKWMLEQHLALVHSVGRPETCSDCGQEFKWGRNLLAHMMIKHEDEKRYRCKFCPLTFLIRKNYVRHQRMKHPERPITYCKLCIAIFDNTKQRDEHECDKFENNGKWLICHRHDSPLIFKRQSEIQEHLKSHDGDKAPRVLQKLGCPVCQKKFLLRKNLLSHLRRFHEKERAEKEFQCKKCSKTFYYKQDCEEHENTHLDTKERNNLNRCHCGKTYNSMKALKVHQKHFHENKDKEHKCSVCGKVLSNQYKLKAHMRVHSDKKPFKCTVCNSTFKANDNLIKHMKKFHSNQDSCGLQV